MRRIVSPKALRSTGLLACLFWLGSPASAQLYSFHGEGMSARLGCSVDGAGDVDADGVAERSLDLGAAPLGAGAGMASPGSTWYFQLWYRDVPGGAPDFNMSNALRVTFCP